MDDSPELKAAIERVKNRRRDAMFCAAYVAVLALVWVVVYEAKLSEYAQGVVTLAIGNFIGYLTAMYNFETGATRSSAAKDTAIVDMTKTAATLAGTNAPPTTPQKVDTVDMTANTVNVTDKKD